MTNKFASTYWSLESSNYFFGSYMTNGRHRVIIGLKRVNNKICSIKSQLHEQRKNANNVV